MSAERNEMIIRASISDIAGVADRDERPLEIGYYLAFDDRCGTCIYLAQEIRKITSKIATIGFSDRRVSALLQELEMDESMIRPTMFRVESRETQAWTGYGLMAKLATVLGPRDSFRIARLIGDMEASRSTDDSTKSRLLRRDFVKGLAGAAAGLALVNTARSSASADDLSNCESWVPDSVAHNYNYIVEDPANCRRCPYTWSPEATTLSQGVVVGVREMVASQDAFGIGNPYWFRTRGQKGCWVYGPLLSDNPV